MNPLSRFRSRQSSAWHAWRSRVTQCLICQVSCGTRGHYTNRWFGECEAVNSAGRYRFLLRDMVVAIADTRVYRFRPVQVGSRSLCVILYIEMSPMCNMTRPVQRPRKSIFNRDTRLCALCGSPGRTWKCGANPLENANRESSRSFVTGVHR